MISYSDISLVKSLVSVSFYRILWVFNQNIWDLISSGWDIWVRQGHEPLDTHADHRRRPLEALSNFLFWSKAEKASFFGKCMSEVVDVHINCCSTFIIAHFSSVANSLSPSCLQFTQCLLCTTQTQLVLSSSVTIALMSYPRVSTALP